MIKKWALGLVALLVIGAGYVYAAYGDVARAGSGYAAKNLCSAYFLSGFPMAVTQSQALVGASPLLGNISGSVDEDGRSVTTRLFGLFERTAVYTPGVGCTLIPPGDESVSIEIQALPRLERSDEAPWPQGTAPAATNPAVQAIIAKGFEEGRISKLRRMVSKPPKPKAGSRVMSERDSDAMTKRVILPTLPVSDEEMARA